MARKKKGIGQILIIGGIALGGYWLWKTGRFDALVQQLSGGAPPAAQPLVPSNLATPPAVDPTVKLATDVAAQAAAVLAAWQASQATGIAEAAAVNAAAEAAAAGAAGAAAAEGAGAAGAGGLDAASIAWNVIGAAIPIWLGTSPAAAEMTHQANIALTHAIGQETGLDKGNVTLMTAYGPFILSRTTGLCYDLHGDAIACPSSDEVMGMEKHSYEHLLREIEQGVFA